MTPLRRLTASVILEGPEPPKRVRIWRAGANPGDYGELWFTRRAADSILADFATRGTLGLIDIEHATNPQANPRLDPSRPPVTAGYYALELVETSDGPELWMLPEWSHCGAPHAQSGVVCCGHHQLTSRQRRYISPDWGMDPESREPLRLNRVSLVAEPATYGIELLANRAGARRAGMNEEQIRAAYALAKMQAAAAEGPLKDSAGAYVEQLKQAAAAMGVDLEAEPAPASERQEGQASADAEPPPPAQPGGEKAPGMAGKTAARPASPAPRGHAPRLPTQSDVDRMVFDANAKADLLAANKDRMTPKMVELLASKPLAEVREHIAALPPRQAPGGTGGDLQGAVEIGPPRGKGKGKAPPLNALDNVVANRIRAGLGQTEEKVAAVEAKLDEQGGYTVSILKLAEEQRGARAAR